MEPLLRSRSEEGERISQIAHSLPPIPVEGFTKVIQAISYLLCVLGTIIVGLRVLIRIKRSRSQRVWGWDDIFAVAGWLPLWPSIVFLIMATHRGLGAHDSQVPDGMLVYYQVIVKEYMFYFEMIYFASSVLTKFAMAIMILRLSSRKIYSYIIWGNMVVLAINAAVCLVIMFVSCSPIPALWNEKLGYCRIKHGWIIISYAGSVFLAMVDWTCAITPFFMLRALQMPKRRKVPLQLILSLGMIGSAAGLVRMGYYHAYDTEKYPIESLYNWGHTILWSVFEAGLGVIACSLPPLAGLFKKFFQGSGRGSAMPTGDRGTELDSRSGLGKGSLPGLRGKGVPQWNRLDDSHSTDSQQNIVKTTHIYVGTSSGECDDDSDRPQDRRKGNGAHWREDV